jgi:hypothetical protein
LLLISLFSSSCLIAKSGSQQKRRRSDSTESAAGPSKKIKIEKENTETKPEVVQVQSTPLQVAKPGPKSQKADSALAQQSSISDNPGGDKSKSEISKEFTSNNDSSNDDEYFCLDCENCNNPKCKHTSHHRRYIQNKTAHIQEYAHGRFQKCSDFMMINKVKVKLSDSAYDSKDGPKIRKLYKKYAEVNKDTSPVNLFEYESGEKVCKIPKCIYRNNSIVYMFRHIREDHFQDH